MSSFFSMWDQLDSDQRPRDYESPALPLSYGPESIFLGGYAQAQIKDLHNVEIALPSFTPHHFLNCGSVQTRTGDLYNVNVAL